MNLLLADAIADTSARNAAQAGAGLVMLFFLVLLYFVPSFVAWARHHRNEGAIGVLNLFLGWTFVGWVVALVWASTDNTKKD